MNTKKTNNNQENPTLPPGWKSEWDQKNGKVVVITPDGQRLTFTISKKNVGE